MAACRAFDDIFASDCETGSFDVPLVVTGLRKPLCLEFGRELLGVELAVLLALELAECWLDVPIVFVLHSRVEARIRSDKICAHARSFTCRTTAAISSMMKETSKEQRCDRGQELQKRSVPYDRNYCSGIDFMILARRITFRYKRNKSSCKSGQLWKEVKQEVDYLLKPQVLGDAERHVRIANLTRIVLIDNLQKVIEVENPPAEQIAQLQNRKGKQFMSTPHALDNNKSTEEEAKEDNEI
uniref:Carboxypeptidase activation peptide domain-containing protein n=1 Tax=Glossina brevipalpis TaxID=37001 RepID=A0A1A9W1H7_9MUSC